MIPIKSIVTILTDLSGMQSLYGLGISLLTTVPSVETTLWTFVRTLTESESAQLTTDRY